MERKEQDEQEMNTQTHHGEKGEEAAEGSAKDGREEAKE